MSKQILILNGSPRIHGNTAALIDAFTAGAEAAGHTVTRFDLAALDIHGCRGCLGGGKDPRHPCVQRDGMDAVYPAYMAADVVVLASPMYYWSISGQLKCAFDRLFAVAELDPNLANPVKDAVLLMAAEGDTEENFAPVRAYYKALRDCLGWTPSRFQDSPFCCSSAPASGVTGGAGRRDSRASSTRPGPAASAETLPPGEDPG